MDSIIQAAITVVALLVGIIAYAWRSSAKICGRRFLAIPVAEYVNAPEKPSDVTISIDVMTICLSDAITTTYSKSSIVAPTNQPATPTSAKAPTSPTTTLSHSPSNSPSTTTKRNSKRVSFATPLATTLAHPAPISTHSHARAGILLSRSSRPWSRHTSSKAHSDSGAQQSCGASSEEQPAAFAFISADTLAMGTASSPLLSHTSSELSCEDWLQGGEQQGLAATNSWSYTAPAASGAFTFPQLSPQAAPTKPFLPRRSPALLLKPTTGTAAAEASMGEEHGHFTVLAEVVLRLGSACAAAGPATKAGSLCAKAAQAAGPVCKLGSSAVSHVDRHVAAAARAVAGYSSRQGQQVVAVASVASSGSTKLLQRCGSSLKRRFNRLVRQASYGRGEVALPA